MRIDYLKVENYRCFKKFEIDFNQNLTVIVAENGVGKTAILDALAVAIGPFVGSFDTGKNQGFKKEDARLIVKEETSQTNLMESMFPIKLEAKGNIQENSIEWTRELTGEKSSTTTKDAKVLQSYAKDLQTHVRNDSHTIANIVLPVISYYGTGRLWDKKHLPHSEAKASRSRLYGYANALDPKSTYKHFEQWFIDISRIQYDKLIRLIDSGNLGDATLTLPSDYGALSAVRSALNTCLRTSGWTNLRYDFEFKELTAEHPEQGTVPVSRLSDGVRNILGMVADIAYRCTKLNPHLENAPKETDGIVLIDEVDMHLHPKWQQHVVQSLMEAFPKIQFIVTTHSPQVLSTVDKANIRLINSYTENAETPHFQTKGVASYEALAHIMSIDPIPDIEEATWLAQYKEYIELKKYMDDEAIKLRTKLEMYFGSEHPEILESDRMIRLMEMKHKLQKKAKKDA